MYVKNHILFNTDGRSVKYKQTPNHGGVYIPQYLIMHYDGSANATGAIDWMTSPKSKVSAHLHIDRAGNITQLAPFNVVCWHAGVSEWKGLSGLNNYSIGIELQNSGTQEYTPAQLAAARATGKALVDAYKLKDILGHSDIAPGRKVDPGKQFPMMEFKKAAGIENGHGTQKLITTADLNLRKGPGTDFGIISTLRKGFPVYIDAVQPAGVPSDWAAVTDVTGTKGFVNTKYLKEV